MNGGKFSARSSGLQSVDDTTDALRFHETIALEPTKDSWYVIAVAGDGDLAPLFTPVEIPYVDLQEVVTEALGGIESVSQLIDPAVPVPREFAIRPFALTNPVWIDRAGDGFDAPGLPTWLHEPAE